MNKLILSILAATSLASQGAVMILPKPTSATASSSFTGPGNFPVERLFDGTITAADVGTTNNQATAYAGNGSGPHTVVYDLGSALDVGGFFFANRAGNGMDTADQVTQIEFWFGNNTTDQAATATFIGANTADFTIDTAASFYRNLAVYDFGSNTNTRFVTMRLTGGTFNPGGQELRLGTNVVPEPSSIAFLGLGGLTLMLRRRK